MNKRDSKIAQQGASKAAARWRARGRSERTTGVISALVAAKLESSFGAMLPKVNLPLVGETSVGALAGAALAARYALKSNPSTVDTALGFGGLALAVKAL